MALNPYQTLGVDSIVKQEDIKSAYRKLAKKFHPDLNPGNKKAENRFKEITSAYELIGNAEDRGEVEAEAAKQYGARQRGPFYSETQAGGGRYASQFDDMDDDILSSIYEQMGRSGDGRFQRAPEDKLYKLDVDFKDAVLGGEQEIEFPRGKKILVKIPAGLESGTKLRFKGKNESNVPGAMPGDIYVQLNVKPSSVFRRVGKDIETELPVSFSDAILGAEVQVPTVDGPIMIKMPENVDDEFRKAVEDWSKRQTKEKV